MEHILHISTFFFLYFGAFFFFLPSIGPSLIYSFAILANILLYVFPLSSLPVVLRICTIAIAIYLL